MLRPFPPAWSAVLPDLETSEDWRRLDAFLADEERRGANVLPSINQRYTALELTPPDAVKVVIVGQDPYPTPGHAHGLAFSVLPSVRPLPGSLRNIYKELQADLGIAPASHGCLTAWARQGVLLLNTVLTVRAGEAASHQKQGWEGLTDQIMGALNARNRPVVFLLWGRQAQAKRDGVTAAHHRVIVAAHPSPLSARLFLGCRCFSAVNRALLEVGQTPVEWRLPAVDTDQGELF